VGVGDRGGGRRAWSGTSIGTLTLEQVACAGRARVVAEVNRNAGSPLADRIVVSGNPIAYGGTLVLTKHRCAPCK